MSCHSKAAYMNDFILDGITWSYSSVNCYKTCPRCFKLSYIDCLTKVNNAFASWGSFMHSLLERYFKGECEFFELSEAYKAKYKENVTEKFPYNAFVDLSSSYYDAGVRYLNNFDGLPDNYDVLGVEQKVELIIEKYKFIGYIDLIIKDKNDNKIIIVDHKSKNKFKSKKEKAEYLRQLYLYSLYIKQKYGEYPKELKFNMIRGEMITETFKESECKKAVEWFTETIKMIYQDNTYDENPDDFFCDNLCGVREHCPKSSKYKGCD